MNKLRQRFQESSFHPDNMSPEARGQAVGISLVLAMGAGAVGWQLGQSEQQAPVFAECKDTQTVDVEALQSYGELVTEHTQVVHEDGSAGSDADITRIIKGLQMNNNPSADSIEISSAATQQSVADALTVFEGQSTQVPVTCTILER